jgi:hypothetical protein
VSNDRWPPQGWPAGPQAPVDGFTAAWQLGRRRRMRTAALSAAPVVVAAVFATSLLTPHGSSPRGLDTVTSKLGHEHGKTVSTTDNQTRPASGTNALTAAGGQSGSGSAVTQPGPSGVVAPVPGVAHASSSPTPRPNPPQPGELTVSGGASSYGAFAVKRRCLVQFGQITMQGGSKYVGIYLRRTDRAGDLGLVFFPQLDQPATKFRMLWGALTQELPAGHYLAYLISDTSASVHIPCNKEQGGDAPIVTVHATRHASVTATVRQSAMSIGQGGAEIRANAPFGPSTFGAVGGFFGSQSNMSNVNLTACLPRPGKACGSGDPQTKGGTDIAIGGSFGGVIDVSPGRVQDARDEMASVSAPATTSGTLYLITVAIH